MQSLKVTGWMVKDKDEEDWFSILITQLKSMKVISKMIKDPERVPINGIKTNNTKANGTKIFAQAMAPINGKMGISILVCSQMACVMAQAQLLKRA